MRSDIAKGLNLKENRFGFEPELTAKLSRVPDIRIYEVGISYYGRTYEEGKKIGWKDGFRAIYCIVKYNIFSKKMRKAFVISISLSLLYILFFKQLLKNNVDPYKYNSQTLLKDKIYSKELQFQIDRIKNDPEWLKQTIKQAKIRGMSIPEMIERNALYIVNQQKKIRRL